MSYGNGTNLLGLLFGGNVTNSPSKIRSFMDCETTVKHCARICCDVIVSCDRLHIVNCDQGTKP